MYKRYSILIAIIWICNIGFSQDFEFKWQVWPSFSRSYTVLIEKRNTKSHIIIKETLANDSIVKRLKPEDCDTLISFLEKYDFPTKGSEIYGPKIREYFETKILPDTNWIQVKGDSIRRGLLWAHGYYFDIKSSMCYSEFQYGTTWTDGNTYKGEYNKSNLKKAFSVYCVRISDLDFELNNLIFNLILKYDSKGDYSQLNKVIKSDKPRENN